METIQEISLGIGVAIAVFGAIGWFMAFYQQPELINGEYYESAWLDIKDSQLTLYVEFVPDGHGRALKAVIEAVCRVKEKSWVNPSIDGRPIVVVLMVREHTILVPISSIVIYNDFTCDRTMDVSTALQRASRNMTFLKDNGTISIVNKTTGEHEHVNMSEFASPQFLENLQCVPTVDATAMFKY